MEILGDILEVIVLIITDMIGAKNREFTKDK